MQTQDADRATVITSTAVSLRNALQTSTTLLYPLNCLCRTWSEGIQFLYFFLQPLCSVGCVGHGRNNIIFCFSLETSTEADITPSFSVTSALRTGSETGSTITAADVGDSVYWTIDIPSRCFI